MRGPTPRRRGNAITEMGVGVGLQVDLMDMSLLACRNKNVRWILTCVDVYSRHAWAIPVKRKTDTMMLQAFQELFRQPRTILLRVTSDNGKEFVNAKISKYFRSLAITHYLSQVGEKNTTGIVERFNRTLRGLMGRNFARLQKLQWIDDLPKLMHNYNHSVHSTIRATPHDVWHGLAVPRFTVRPREPFLLKTGQHVRTLIPRTQFEKKADAQRWSTDVYTVARREGFKYVLHDMQGNEVDTRYRPSHLNPIPEQAAQKIQARIQEQQQVALEAKRKKIQRQRRAKTRLQRQGLVLPLQPSRLRPGTKRQRVRRG